MDKEGIDTIAKLFEFSLKRRWPKFEFSVETALVPTGKRIQVNVASQTSLLEYFGDYEGVDDIKAGYCCFYITLHPSKLTMLHIEETYTVVERRIMEQEIIFESAE
tara:strand:- start:683 stop:1000 length:318 start_codon:yes stop_codon:yes gene_type:complete